MYDKLTSLTATALTFISKLFAILTWEKFAPSYGVSPRKRIRTNQKIRQCDCKNEAKHPQLRMLVIQP